MRLNERQIHRLADSLLSALLSEGGATLKRERGLALARIEAIILDNLHQEELLMKQARSLLESHLKAAGGDVDRHRMLQMIVRKLAEEKDFPL